MKRPTKLTPRWTNNFPPTSHKKRRQFTNIRNKKKDITTDTKDIKRLVTGCHKQFYVNKLDHVDEMDKFLENNILPKTDIR